MIVAIMQPYFFPYIGYFQLMHAVDTFVFLDDVQYVDRSWMSRNRIRRDGRSAWLSMPVKGGPRSAAINERRYVLGEAQDAVVRKVSSAYSSAPFYQGGSSFVLELVRYAEGNVAKFNANLLREVSTELGTRTTLVPASQIRADSRLAGQGGIIDLCKRLDATRYVNAIGGVGLYDEASFARAGIELAFIRTRVPPVPLADGPEHLSIIDGLMYDGMVGCREMLPDYDLMAPSAVRSFP